MGMTDSQRQAITQMLDTAEDLDRWRLRAHRIEQPERGSDLAQDDQIFEWMPISEVVRLSLVASGEHLRLALDAVKAEQLYPSSHFTVLRGALVGASQAVWILAPDEQVARRERGLTVIAEMYAQMGKYYNFLETTALEADDQTRLSDQKLWLAERSAQVAARKNTGATLNLTDVIGSAVDTTFPDRRAREALRGLWRQMSADAHVLGWSMFQRATFGPPDRRTGLGEGKAGGVPELVAEPFLGSYRLLKRGWSLFDQRCEAR
ncbi:hypothetical protein [Microbacterium sp. RURRCA19A]|uniref:hypothetical protein n=1 Tax=Microbacterium sp. RURRCA19A TaxID=1907391 RepID=UPI000953C441|nr:hypothetical protein [Microbacterium sp. RURRCA19A]SIR79423.1 hypothetical protein SAMN05880568_1504 [Microbacterium sp. RURRCA19A]